MRFVHLVLFALALIFFSLVLGITAPASAAADMPRFCTNPTKAERQNVALQKACRGMEELDYFIEMVHSFIQTRQFVGSVEEVSRALKQRYQSFSPPPKDSIGRAIPLHPAQLNRGR